MILYLPQDDKLSSGGLWMFQISTLASFETEVYELLNLFDSSGIVTWTKIDQNFLASKYDIKQHSDAPLTWVIYNVFIK